MQKVKRNGPLPKPTLLRFMSKVNTQTKSGFWEWIAGKDHNGYGAFYNGSTMGPAPRWLYVHLYGDSMLSLDHLCRNRACVNPDHLELIPLADNILRGVGPSAKNRRKTHCIRRHKLSGPNLHINTRGERVCKVCRNAAAKRYRSE